MQVDAVETKNEVHIRCKQREYPSLITLPDWVKRESVPRRCGTTLRIVEDRIIQAPFLQTIRLALRPHAFT